MITKALALEAYELGNTLIELARQETNPSRYEKLLRLADKSQERYARRYYKLQAQNASSSPSSL